MAGRRLYAPLPDFPAPSMTVRFVVAVVALLVVAAGCEMDASTPSSTARASAEAEPDTAMVRDITVGGTADLVREAVGASPSVAIQTIDLWVARLDTASVEGGGEIRDGLVTLRNQLQSNPLDGAAIGQTMTHLGEQTAAVDSADAALGTLAAALRTVGRRLAPEPVEADSTGGE